MILAPSPDQIRSRTNEKKGEFDIGKVSDVTITAMKEGTQDSLRSAASKLSKEVRHELAVHGILLEMNLPQRTRILVTFGF